MSNQILKYTLWFLSQVGSYSDATLSQTLRRTYSAFAEVGHQTISAADCRQIHFDRLNQRYQMPINLASLLLQHLSLEGNRGSHRFDTYLIDMNVVFEKFVAEYLVSFFENHPSLSIGIQEHFALDDDGRYKARPDIIIHDNNRPIAILDTKYKVFESKTKIEDVYQVLAYCQRKSVTNAVLVYTSNEFVNQRDTFSGVSLRAVALDLSGDLHQFQNRCTQFAEWLQNEDI